MAELLLELFSEEIPARMQARAAEDLARLLGEALKAEGLPPRNMMTYCTPRRLALVAGIDARTADIAEEKRGPRVDAPAKALDGFLKASGVTREQLEQRDTGKGVYYFLTVQKKGQDAAAVLARALPDLLWRFPWPKSMRWGGTSQFVWVRPLRRILCLLDGQVVPFALAREGDDAHGLVSGAETEGHRFHAPGAFTVRDFADYRTKLLARNVILDAADRRAKIKADAEALAAAQGFTLVPDEGLLDEVAGLVEWPVALMGRIDAAFMDLPAEVLQTSMRVNQRYFSLRRHDGAAAPHFVVIANVATSDGGAAVVAGNERVLRARLADARFFWDQDRAQRLDSRLPALGGIVFHARLGTIGQKVERLVALVPEIVRHLGLAENQGLRAAVLRDAERAALLAKADLVSGMVGEFPELQGIMGAYYARHDGETDAVANAIAEHYAPKGPNDRCPTAPASVAVALAEKIDTLAGFFAVGERPTGSGDPYGLRRAALGLIRLVRENTLRLPLRDLFDAADKGYRKQFAEHWPKDSPLPDLLAFTAERLRVQLRAEGARHDVLDAVFAAGADDDLVRVLRRADALRDFLATEDGANLLVAYRRAANILRIEEKRDGPHAGAVDAALLRQGEEQALAAALDGAAPAIGRALSEEAFAAAMAGMAGLRGAVDAFFDKVTVNAPEPDLRRNRLRLLARIRAVMDEVADFSRIEG
ncbi:MAG: glycine--tRNA ligase subunit beta [Alphaproteobacteria bacterium]|nr:glycine--tRNA ligase subunit beta [Alphaproteobacteria bacterium]